MFQLDMDFTCFKKFTFTPYWLILQRKGERLIKHFSHFKIFYFGDNFCEPQYYDCIGVENALYWVKQKVQIEVRRVFSICIFCRNIFAMNLFDITIAMLGLIKCKCQRCLIIILIYKKNRKFCTRHPNMKKSSTCKITYSSYDFQIILVT